MKAVVDASALGALLFGEPEQQAIAARLRGYEMHAPSLLPFEIASIAIKKMRRKELPENLALDALAAFAHLPVQLAGVTSEACAVVALETGLSAYDAAYLVLARQLKVPVVTLDAKLRKASSS